jgi:hypothetical protein
MPRDARPANSPVRAIISLCCGPVRSLLAIFSALALAAACSGSDDDQDWAGDVGAACTDGSSCAEGLLCFVEAPDSVTGACAAPPSACGGELRCDCLLELCSNGVSCSGVNGRYVVGCGQGDVYLKEGEPCSSVRYCESGLFCSVAKPGQAGTCTSNPEACADELSCDCFSEVRAQCLSGSRCSVAGDKATITCS